MQKIECRKFIEKKPGWKLCEEYYEKGISAYKLSLKDRNIIQQIKMDAKNGRFDVLLVFMFDRLGRLESEIPLLMQDFYKLGVEIWSVIEGEQKFDNNLDRLVNYIRFYQSSQESEKTSIRISVKHRQMVDDGIFRGGRAPFGYKYVESNRMNRDGEYTRDLAVDEEKADIVMEIYYLVYNRGFGSLRIQEYLVEKGYKSPTDKMWGRASIQNILTNPIYKGRFTFGKNGNDKKRQERELWNISETKRNDLEIIPEDVWEAVQAIRTNKSPMSKKHNDNKIIGTPSPLLLIGLVRCGHCKNIISTTYNYSRWTRKNGEKCVTKKAIYRCNGRIDKRVNCDGQTTYNKNKLENTVENKLYCYIEKLKSIDLYPEIDKFMKEKVSDLENEVNGLKLLKETVYGEIELLNEEVLKALKGDSSFTPETISIIKETKEFEIIKLQEKIDIISIELKQNIIELNNFIFINNFMIGFWEKYENFTVDERRMVLSKIIDVIYVYKDRIDIRLKPPFGEIIENATVRDI